MVMDTIGKQILSFSFIFFTHLFYSQSIIKDLDTFDTIKVFDKIQLVLVSSSEDKIEISGSKQNDVVVVQNGLLLKVRMSIENMLDAGDTRVIVYYTGIKKIDANEGARVEVEGVLRENQLDIRAQEGARVIATIESEDLIGKAVTGGRLELDGSVNKQSIRINSGGHFYGKNLNSALCNISISAGGYADVKAKQYIKANTNAGGTIKIYGKPREIDSQKLLGGKIIEVNN